MYWLSFERNVPHKYPHPWDFGLLIFNQLINLAAKYESMFGGLFEVPICSHDNSWGWGQGAQHSQRLQSLLAHIPGLTVVMPSSIAITAMYSYAISSHRGSRL